MEQCAVMNGPTAERRIIEACRAGSREALRQLFEVYKDRVFSIAFGYLRDEAAAEDVTQEVFLRLSARISQFRGDAEFSTWLYRLVANACVDEQRRRRRLVPLDSLGETRTAPAEPPPEEHCLRLEMTEAVQAAVAGLKPHLRMAVLMKYYDDLSYDEMAAALGCSKGTVASRLHRGLAALARTLAHLRPASAGAGGTAPVPGE